MQNMQEIFIHIPGNEKNLRISKIRDKQQRNYRSWKLVEEFDLYNQFYTR